MSVKIAFIGAGSLGFTRRLVADLLAVPELQDSRFAFMDISAHNLDMVTQICRKDIKANGMPAKIKATTNRREALKDADYVVCSIRHGGLRAFSYDIDIPLKYGIDQCVGDTLAPGGIMYAQRHIPELLDICADMRAVAKPDALMLNYANPMAMNTWACLKYGGVRFIGLCHGVEHGHKQLANALGIPPQELDFVCAGINHQTWYIKLDYKGQSMLDKVQAAMEKHPDFSRYEKVRIDVLKRFGYYSTESNGHLSEYLPWYRKRTGTMKKWFDLSNKSWITGETGGYLRVCMEGRNWFENEFPQLMKGDALVYAPEKRTSEHASWIIESLETGRLYRGHFNVRNNGVITNIPQDCVVEVPCYVDRTGVSVPVVGDLPLGCAAILRNTASVQELGMEAAVNGDLNLLRQAMMLDPLAGAICEPDEIWQMTDEMLVAQAEWLPQYKSEVSKAKKRLAEQKPLGTKKLKGLRVKSKMTIADMHKMLEDSGTGTKTGRKK